MLRLEPASRLASDKLHTTRLPNHATQPFVKQTL
jgi:hypothetical protein